MRYSYTKALETVKKWALKEGYEAITFNHHESYIDWYRENRQSNIPKVIKIEGKYPIESKVYLLLHELGHHQLRKDWAKFKKTLPIVAFAEHIHIFRNVGKYKRRITYSISCVEEEFKAWEEGYKLAQKLGVKINLKKWNDLKSKCLMTYVRHYGSKK